MSAASSPSEDKIVILDFGSQYTQVIARRSANVASIRRFSLSGRDSATLRAIAPKGIILSGGPASVYALNAPRLDKGIYRARSPPLGHLLWLATHRQGSGGHGGASDASRIRPGKLQRQIVAPISFTAFPQSSMSGTVTEIRLRKLPEGFRVLGRTENSGHAAIGDAKRRIYGLQFHPEVAHTPRGKEILENFVHRICGCKSQWTMGSFIVRACMQIRETVGDGRVILGLSGRGGLVGSRRPYA